MNKTKYNKQARKLKEIRTGVTVQGNLTVNGAGKTYVGIVGYREKDAVTVALPSAVMWCERWTFPVNEVTMVADNLVSKSSKHYKGAWEHILTEAHRLNVEYEKDRSRDAVEGLVAVKGSTITERFVDTLSGQTKYVRWVLPNIFDFEFDVTTVDVGLADKINYAYALASGLPAEGYMKVDIVDSRIVKVPLEPKDVNYGEAFGWVKGYVAEMEEK
ncbi:hypothetical protein B4086_5771 [Bacillus cereus]|nr:hypothetical protein B4086_5771 [Bacillus cereus]